MNIINKLMQEFPMEAKNIGPSYHSDTMVVFRPNVTVDTPTVFDSYHFVIPSSPSSPGLIVDKKTFQLTQDRLFPTNPGQVLVCPTAREVKEFTAIFIDKETVRDTCYQICRKSEINFINNNYVLSNYGRSLIRQFMDECTNKQFGYEFILQSLSMQLIATLIRELDSSIKIQPFERSYDGKANIKRSIAFLKDCYNSNFSLQEIAKTANLSPYHFIRVFKAETGKTPFEYLMDIKIERAKEFLKSKQYSITEIGLLCGFTSTSHFSRVFRKKTGLSPSEYRDIIG